MLSTQYATALYELVTNNIDDVKNEFDCLMQILKNDNDFLKFLVSPVIKKEKKKQVITNCFKNFNTVFVDFCLVLVDNNRFNIIDDIYKDFNNTIANSKGITIVNAYTTLPLSDLEKDALADMLKVKFPGNVVINNIIDENVIGGMRLEHNGISIDQTTITQMHNLKSLL